MRITRKRIDDERERRWVVDGEHGAVEYHENVAVPGAVGIETHSFASLVDGDEPQPCPVLDGPCYSYGTSLGAKRLQFRYRHGDESVIWDELERRYRNHLEGSAQ